MSGPVSDRRELRLLVTDRAEGKTTQAFAWVSNGVRINAYPGWSRVLVVSHPHLQEHFKDPYWSRLEDYDHRVYSAEDWLNVRGVGHDVEVCLDDLDWFLGARVGPLAAMPGRIVCATITAWPWEQQTFKERPEMIDHG